MTIIYNNKSHFDVIFKIQGSIWPEVLPFCIFNVVVTATIWLLRDKEIFDLSFDGGLGYQFISVLVSFFVVSNINTTYSRFWEARGFVGKALNAAGMLADRAALYSSQSNTAEAQIWRDALRVRLCQLVTVSMHIIQNERAAMLNLMKAESAKRKRRGRRGKRDAINTNTFEVSTHPSTYERHGLRKSLVKETVDALKTQEGNCATLGSMVDAVIVSNGKYLGEPLVIHKEMELLSRTTAFFDAIHGLMKFSTTPIPFVTVQMGRTIVFAWVLFLPFAIISDRDDNIWEATLLVFLVTYGFMGLTLAEIEMHDPLGTDDNDIETDRYTKFTIDDIEESLGAKGHATEDFFASAFDIHSSESGNGYDSIV